MRRSTMFGLMMLASTSVAWADMPVPRTTHHALRTSFKRTPGIRIWTSGDDLVRRGERVRVFYRTERDAYVTIFRVDTDGRVRVIFPRSFDDDNYGYGGATYSAAVNATGASFYVDDYPGVGYIFGVASTAPFNYDPIWDGHGWDIHAVSDGRIHGDPMSSLEEIVQRMLPPDFGDYDTHLLPYYVEQRYNYPRFVCYDCHTYMPYAYWDPYLDWCRRYTLVVWNDPYYYYPSYWYPTRYYGGTRVVYTSRGYNDSRYVFKTRDNSAPGIDYRDRRSTPTYAQGTSRRTNETFVRGSDIGGVGSIPAPRGVSSGGTRRSAPIGQAGGDQPRGDLPRGSDAPDDRRAPRGDRPAPGAIDDGRRDAGGRRRMSDVETPQRPADAPNDNPARPVRAQPGIEIVPSGRTPDARPAEPRTPESRPAENPRRQVEQPPRSSDEPRPPRPDVPVYRQPAAPVEVKQPGSRRQPEYRQPESRQPEARQPEARQPEARQPEARQPEARQPQARQPERPREQPQPQARQPESRPQPQARAPESRPASPPSNPGLVRRRNP